MPSNSPNSSTEHSQSAVLVSVHYCIPEDQKRHLPKRRQAPAWHPVHAPLPRQGEVIYLTSASAWGVEMVIHEWRNNARELHVEVWLSHVPSRNGRPTGFMLTQ